MVVPLLARFAKASEKAAVTRENSESQLRDRLNKQALKNAILLERDLPYFYWQINRGRYCCLASGVEWKRSPNCH
ncbi:hypothetical protein QUA54_16700 [Microcoleus sp. MOSTC5]|uniref:hypothetical protein n=1 Tax=Microcoleus sp. MOSTC5 TaxID=3055378 RepID=UPI002FD3CB75